ncbi:AAA family ATPase [Blattabacterium cuenoti]|uniref:AAA family ATPase n=1 Tax=Blattabacterium cuenoti TaxID=1653831 RepID=UPI00163B65CA|nr:AAA family ATPase [Blattabacterium cuenoti]
MNNFFSKNFVLSDKYSPLKWDDIVGQKDITSSLKNAIKYNQLSQFLFFVGPDGVGKNTCAKVLANELNNNFDKKCYNNIFEIDCLLNSCIYSYNFHEIIIDRILFYPKLEKYNIFIIKNIHVFSQKFINFLLNFIKGKYTEILFIFCTKKQNNIPISIRSYSQIYEFKSLSIKEIFFHIKMISDKENIKVDSETLFLLSQHVNGSISKAIYVFEKLLLLHEKKISKDLLMKELGIVNITYYFDIVNYLLLGDTHKIFLLLDKIFQEKVNFINFIIGLIEHFRNLFLSKKNETLSLLKLKKEIIQSYIEQSGNISYSLIIKSINMSSYLIEKYQFDKIDDKFIIEIFLIKLANYYDNTKNVDKKKIEKNLEYCDYDNNDKISFIKKNWIDFLQKFSDKMNSIYIDFLKEEIQFCIENNDICCFIVPNELKGPNFLLVQSYFIKYLKNKFNYSQKFKVIGKKSEKDTLKNYAFLSKKNKFTEKLIEKLNLKISSIS